MNAHDNTFQTVPQNVEAEQQLLGCILINNNVYDLVARILEPEHFFDPLHRVIFEKIGGMLMAGKGVNPVTMKGYLPDQVKGLTLDGEPATVMAYLARMAANAASVGQARDYAAVIHDMFIARHSLALAQEAVETILDMQPGSDILDRFAPLEDSIANLRAQRLRGENRIGVGKHYLENMTTARQRGQVRGVPLCLSEIEEVISEPCLEAGNLYGQLSSSGEGKTSLTLQLILFALKKGHPVLFLSYDQSGDQCIRQMVAQEYGIEARRQRFADLSEKEWAKAVDFGNWIDTQPFQVVKCTDQSAAQLVSLARTFVKRFGNGEVPLIVVDHIGSVTPEDKRADEGTKAKNINKVFKAGAEMTDAAWLILNQRNSYGMKRDNPRPISADLFGGDPAKQAYDAIMYLYRQEKFKQERMATAATDADWKKINKVFAAEAEGIAEIGAVKCRFGSPFIRKTVNFEDRFTRYVSERATEQASLIEGF